MSDFSRIIVSLLAIFIGMIFVYTAGGFFQENEFEKMFLHIYFAIVFLILAIINILEK